MEMEMHCTTNDVLLESLDQVEKLKLDVQIRLQFKFDNSYALCIFWGVHKLSKSRYIVYAISDVFMFFRLLNFTTFNTCREKKYCLCLLSKCKVLNSTCSCSGMTVTIGVLNKANKKALLVLIP